MNIPLGQWSGSDATKALEQTIVRIGGEEFKGTKDNVGLDNY
jgi:hypothetical protein